MFSKNLLTQLITAFNLIQPQKLLRTFLSLRVLKKVTGTLWVLLLVLFFQAQAKTVGVPKNVQNGTTKASEAARLVSDFANREGADALGVSINDAVGKQIQFASKFEACATAIKIGNTSAEATMDLILGNDNIKKLQEASGEGSMTEAAIDLQKSCSHSATLLQGSLTACSGLQAKSTPKVGEVISADEDVVMQLSELLETDPKQAEIIGEGATAFSTAKTLVAEGYKELVVERDKVVINKGNMSACESGFMRFANKLWNNCDLNRGKCAAIVGGTAAVGYGIKKYMDDKDDDDKKDKQKKKDKKAQEEYDNKVAECKEGSNYMSPACHNILQEQCSATEDFDVGCTSFYTIYCTTTDDRTAVNEDAGFCEEEKTRHYCANTEHASSPSCKKVASNDLLVCKDDPTQCEYEVTDTELETVCLPDEDGNDSVYKDDPMCVSYIEKKVAGETGGDGDDGDGDDSDGSDDTAPAGTSVVDNGEGDTADETTGNETDVAAINPFTGQSVPVTDISGPYSEDLFGAMSSNITNLCDKGQAEGCILKSNRSITSK